MEKRLGVSSVCDSFGRGETSNSTHRRRRPQDYKNRLLCGWRRTKVFHFEMKPKTRELLWKLKQLQWIELSSTTTWFGELHRYTDSILAESCRGPWNRSSPRSQLSERETLIISIDWAGETEWEEGCIHSLKKHECLVVLIPYLRGLGLLHDIYGDRRLRSEGGRRQAVHFLLNEILIEVEVL